MKKMLMLATTILLSLALLAGCGRPQTELPDGTAPSGFATLSTTEPAAETTPTETEEDVEYEGDASSYYIDVVYAQQIDRYYTAISQQWDESTYMDNEMSPWPRNTVKEILWTMLVLPLWIWTETVFGN